MPKEYIQEIKVKHNYFIDDHVLDFACTKHMGQYRKDGEEFIMHPLKVADKLLEKGIDNRYVIHAAICHDILEDKCASLEELKEVISECSLNLVLLLTKEHKESTRKYLKRIKSNSHAFNIKMADRVSNLWDSLKTSDYDFILSYYNHTTQNYLKLSKGTIWENEMIVVLNKIEYLLKEIDKK